jgi:hypothetical protein
MAKLDRIDGGTLVIGERDPVFSRTIGTINMFTENFFVFLDEKHQVWWYTTRAWGEAPEWLGSVVSRVADLEAVTTGALRDENRQTYGCLIADGVARALERDRDAAFLSLDLASKYVKARLGEKARGWYLIASAVLAFLAAVSPIVVWQHACDGDETCLSYGRIPAYCVGMGVLGACVSIIIRLGKLDVDPEAGRALNLGEACARIATGGIAGFLLFLAVRSKLVAPALLDGSTAGLMLLAFAAGASERLVPSLIQTVESLTNGTKARPPAGETQTAATSAAPHPASNATTSDAQCTPPATTAAKAAAASPTPPVSGSGTALPAVPDQAEASKVSDRPLGTRSELAPKADTSRKETKS